MKTILLAFGAVRLLKEMQMILSRFLEKPPDQNFTSDKSDGYVNVGVCRL
jgi:hypothetical protein